MRVGLDAYPDLVMSHTATWRSVSVMKKIGAKKLYDPNRLAIVLDHISPAKTEKYAADQQTSRNFAREYGIEKFYDVDAGIVLPLGERDAAIDHQPAACVLRPEAVEVGVHADHYILAPRL